MPIAKLLLLRYSELEKVIISGLNCLMTLYPLRRLWSTGYLNFLDSQRALDCKRSTTSNRMMTIKDRVDTKGNTVTYWGHHRSIFLEYWGTPRNVSTKRIGQQVCIRTWTLRYIKPASKKILFLIYVFRIFEEKYRTPVQFPLHQRRYAVVCFIYEIHKVHKINK